MSGLTSETWKMDLLMLFLIYYSSLDFGMRLCRYFDYLFYVDFEASMADPNSQNALGHLKVEFPFTLCLYYSWFIWYEFPLIRNVLIFIRSLLHYWECSEATQWTLVRNELAWNPVLHTTPPVSLTVFIYFF